MKKVNPKLYYLDYKEDMVLSQMNKNNFVFFLRGGSVILNKKELKSLIGISVFLKKEWHYENSTFN